MDIKKILQEEKPDVSINTIKAYYTNLNKINKMITNQKEIKNLDFLTDSKKVLEVLSNLTNHTIKNNLVSVVVILGSNKAKYKDIIEEYNQEIKKLQAKIADKYDDNEKSEKQKENWIDYKDVLELLKTYKKDTKPLLEKDKDDLTKKEKDLIQQYLVLYLYSGKAFPIVRNDFADMKIVNDKYDMDNNKNYLVIPTNKKTPYFKLNEYKTSKYKGEFNIPLKDMELRKLIYNWIKITNSPVLLLNLSGNRTTEKNTPMTANGISKYLNKIFKKHFNKTISTSLLRSIMITDKYSNNLSTKEKKKLANDMGHSKGIAENVYNKID